MTSEIKSSTLKVKGFLKKLDFLYEPWYPNLPAEADGQYVRLLVGTYTSDECRISLDELGTCFLKYADARTFPSADCLILTCGYDTKYEMEFLLVERLSMAEDCSRFRRIGRGKLTLEGRDEMTLPEIFADAEPTTLELA
jgi:hypothetical protein